VPETSTETEHAPEAPCTVTEFGPGLACAGTVGHPGDCTPNADDIPAPGPSTDPVN